MYLEIKLSKVTALEKKWIEASGTSAEVQKSALSGLSAKYWASFFTLLDEVCIFYEFF